MKKIVFKILWAGIIQFSLISCEVDEATQVESLTDTGKNVYSYVESYIGNMVELFENSLRLSEEISINDNSGNLKYFAGESLVHDQQGWWGIAGVNGCRFKLFCLNDKSFSEEGARWVARSQYYANDSILVECIDTGHWSLKGYALTSASPGAEISMEIMSAELKPSAELDSVAYYIDLTGVSHIFQYYPPEDVSIEYSMIHPLLRKARAERVYYPFVEGLMKIEVTDLRSGRKRNFLSQIESLPLKERMVKITAEDATAIY